MQKHREADAECFAQVDLSNKSISLTEAEGNCSGLDVKSLLRQAQVEEFQEAFGLFDKARDGQGIGPSTM